MPVGALPTPNGCCTPRSQSSGGGSNIPGPQGPPGANGTNGTNGLNAYTTLTAGFTQPTSGSNVTISVVASGWATPGQNLAIQSGGDYQLVSIPNATSLTVKNLGYPNNAAPGASIANGQSVSPSGQRGPAGIDGSSAGNPTTTKGDLSTHDGSAPARLSAGSDGKVLVSDATQGTGNGWKTVLPNTATDNAIPRYDGASGKPVPLQGSSVIITDEGAIQTVGGDARGLNAVDLQTVRGASTQVASGARSFIGGGSNNTAAQNDAAVTAGTGNVAGASKAFIGGGDSNTVSGEAGVIVGGSGNNATGQNNFIGAGSGNEITADYGVIAGGNGNGVSASGGFVGGGSNNTAAGGNAGILCGFGNAATGTNAVILGGSEGLADKYGQITRASGKFSTQGDAQTSELIWRIQTTDATPGVEMFLNGSNARASIDQSFAWTFHIDAVGRDNSGNCASWEVKGCIRNNGGSVAIVGSVTTTLIAADAGITGTWGQASKFVVSADSTNDSLKLAVTGVAATTINWVATGHIVEVKLA